MVNKHFNELGYQEVISVVDSIQYGYTGKALDKGKYYYLRITDIQNGRVEWESVPFADIQEKDAHKYLLSKGDILFARTGGTVGKSFLYQNGDNSIFASYLIRLKPNVQKVLPEYLYNFFQSPSYWQQIRGAEMGAAQPNVNGNKLGKIRVPIPPIPEQHRIVAKLDSLFVRIDRAIELTQQNIVRAQQFMTSVLNDVLDGLDCDKLKLQDGCVINPLKSEVKALGDLNVSFLPMVDLNEHQIDFVPKQTKKLSEVYTGYTYFRDGDVLLAKVTPCFENGKAGLARNLVNGIGFGSSEYYVLRATPNILSAYIYYNLTSSEFLRLGAQNMSGAVGLKRVTKDFLFNYEIPVPSLVEQEKVVKYFADQTIKVSTLTLYMKNRLSKLSVLKSSLLDAAFKGKF
jgi:type I restriction enzyme S subunit